MASQKLKEIIRKLRNAEKFHMKVGILKGATYDDTGLSVAQVGMWNEFGTSTSPPRPFMRTTIREHKGDWMKVFKDGLNAYLDGRATLQDVGDAVGVSAQTHLMETIDSNMPPPNAPSTYRRKLNRVKRNSKGGLNEVGNATPRTLVDSGVMRDSISYEVDS